MAWGVQVPLSAPNWSIIMSKSDTVYYAMNRDFEYIRDTTKFLWFPTTAYVDHSLGLVGDYTRWLVTARVRQKYVNGTWKTFEFLD